MKIPGHVKSATCAAGVGDTPGLVQPPRVARGTVGSAKDGASRSFGCVTVGFRLAANIGCVREK